MRNLNLMVVLVPVPVIIRSMKRGHEMTICVLVSVLLSAGAKAITEDPTRSPAHGIPESKNPAAPALDSSRPYGGIVDRNVFNLHPPPPPVDPSELAKKNVQIPKLTLNGITTILGKKIVFLTVPATKPGTTQETLMLAEGEAEEEVEVKQIDEKAGVVKVVNHGENQTLDFDHDGTKPLPPGANPAMPVTIPPIPGTPPPNVIPQPAPSMMRPLRTIQPRTTSFSGGSMNNGAYGGGMVETGVSSETAQTQPALTPEQQVEIIEAQRMNALQQGDPIANLLPPTEHTQEIMDGASGRGQAAQ